MTTATYTASTVRPAPGCGTRACPEAGCRWGFLVPPALRPRWTLILGDARDELPPLLRRLGTIDVFFHDSDHRYAHMMWEYTTVWPHLAAGGLLISDDISFHTALWDFAAGVGAPVVIHRANANVGAIVRREGAC
ncbi:MAG: hypothetical protein C4290_12070 [Chloroflexota bacterium]